MPIRSIGVIGAGVIGSSWAAFYAGKGLHVHLYDIEPRLCEEGSRRARETVGVLERGGLIQKGMASQAISRITVASGLQERRREREACLLFGRGRHRAARVPRFARWLARSGGGFPAGL